MHITQMFFRSITIDKKTNCVAVVDTGLHRVQVKTKKSIRDPD